MRWIALTLTCIAAAGAVATAATARTGGLIVATTGPTAPLATGLGDPVFQTSQATTAYTMARSAGATYARLFVHWAAIAPQTNPGPAFHQTDPNSPYYHWGAMDASVSAANAAGVTPILDILDTPDWAYHVQPNGLWKGGQPDVGKLGAFATALAKHYDGGSSPYAHVFSVGNEPNFNRNLYPQDPTYYRSMVNAVSDSVHAVHSANLMAAGELAPFKHVPSGTDKNNVMAPITFMQQMFCLSTTTPVHRTCSGNQAKIDVWTHHPYSDKGPYGKASVAGGVELGDLPKMNTLLQTAWNLGAISAAHPPQFWVTEVGWSSKPPNKHGVPMGLLVRWTGETMYQMWKSGVTVGTWFLLQDEPSNTPFQSGLYLDSASLSNAVAKALRTPFSFPFVAYRKSLGKVLVWGRVTTSDVQDVAIQEKIPSKPWKTVATVKSNSYGIFTATLNLHSQKTWSIKAIAPGSGTSATFSLTVPSNENMKVVPFPAG